MFTPNHPSSLKKYLISFLLSTFSIVAFSQHPSLNVPLNRIWNLEFEKKYALLNDKTHNSIYPMLQGQLADLKDSLASEEKSWWYRKVYKEHLVDIRKQDWMIQLDPLGEIEVGRTENDAANRYTGAIQLQGGIGSKFAFYTSVFSTWAFYPNYLTAFGRTYSILPGQGDAVPYTEKGFNHFNSLAYISFSPNSHFNFQFGHGRNFIGNGYRSLLLSDGYYPHPYFRILTNIGPIQYVYLLSQYTDLLAPKLSKELGFRQKYSAISYLDWRIGKRLSLGLFQAVIWQADDSTGRRGIDPNYLNPIVFLRPIERNLGSEGNMILGLNSKFKIVDGHLIYFQFVLDEFDFRQLQAQNGYWANKYGYQLGYKGFDLFHIPNLSINTEYNVVRPFTYSHWTSLTNYSHFNEPLAHPFGANFREWQNFINYRFKRYYCQIQYMNALVGFDENGLSWGQNIFASYFVRVRETGNEIGQGLTTRIHFTQVKLGYILNTRTNMRLELTGSNRNAINNNETLVENWFTVGISTNVRNLYFDR